VLGSSPEKSAAAAKALGARRGYASLDEMLVDSAVQAVHLTSPNRCHFEQSRRALDAGKHVICEKPLAMDADQSRRLVAQSQRSKGVAAVCYNIRFYP